MSKKCPNLNFHCPILFAYLTQLLSSKDGRSEPTSRTAVSSLGGRGGASQRKWQKMRFRPKVFQSLLYIIYNVGLYVPPQSPSPGGQFLETALIREVLFVSFQCLIFILANGIECYVCTGQEHNDDKCIKTVNTCLQDQSVCMTRVEWRCKYIYYLPTSLR